MKEIWYEEFAPNRGFPRLQDSLSERPYPFQNEISSYLKRGKPVLTQLSRAKDVFTDEKIPYEAHLLTDGEYLWPNELAWYVEKHNLRLQKDFEDYILEQLNMK